MSSNSYYFIFYKFIFLRLLIFYLVAQCCAYHLNLATINFFCCNYISEDEYKTSLLTFVIYKIILFFTIRHNLKILFCFIVYSHKPRNWHKSVKLFTHQLSEFYGSIFKPFHLLGLSNGKSGSKSKVKIILISLII